MTDEEKKAQLEAEQKAKEEAEAKAKADAEAQDDSDDSKESEDIDNEIDYKAKAEKYDEMKRKAKEASLKRKEKREQEEEAYEPVDEKDQPITKGDLEEFMARQTQATEEKINANKVENLISKSTGSDDEAMLVKKILNDTKFPDGYTLEDRVRGAIALANSDKLVGENSELKRALENRSGVSSDPTGNYQAGQTPPTLHSQISEGKALVLKQQGYTLNKITKRYEKKLSENEKMVYDVKTNQYVRMAK